MKTICIYDMEDYDNARDTMTLEDIVEYLAHIQRGYVGSYSFSGDEDDFERYKLQIAMSKAIEIIRELAESED